MIGRTLVVDVGDLVVAGRVGLQVESGIARLHAFLGRTLAGQAAAAGDAGVRSVDVADHLHDDVVQLLGVGDVGEQRLVRVLGRGPVDAVHVGIVEAVLHDAPGFFEDLLALGGDIDFHAHGEGDAARSRRRRHAVSVVLRRRRRPAASAAAAASGRGRRAGRCPLRRGCAGSQGCRCRRPAGSRCCGCRGSTAARCRRRIRRVRRVRDRRRRRVGHRGVQARQARAIFGDGVHAGTAAALRRHRRRRRMAENR